MNLQSVLHHSSRITVIAGALVLVGCSMAPAATSPGASPTQPPVVIEASKLITWPLATGGVIGVMVIQQVHNVGEDWVQIAARDSTYEIKAPNGNVVAANNFRHAYPTYLGPGDFGYLIDQYLEGSVPIENITTLTVSPRFRDLDQRPERRLSTTNLTLRSDELPGGLYVTGEAENVGESDIASGHVGAVFFDAAGEIIGSSTTDLLEHVAVGESGAFETRPSNPLEESAVADFVVMASPTL